MVMEILYLYSMRLLELKDVSDLTKRVILMFQDVARIEIELGWVGGMPHKPPTNQFYAFVIVHFPP